MRPHFLQEKHYNGTIYAGADQGFSFRGAQKIMCVHSHHERSPKSLIIRPGSMTRLRALEALRVFDALSYNI